MKRIFRKNIAVILSVILTFLSVSYVSASGEYSTIDLKIGCSICLASSDGLDVNILTDDNQIISVNGNEITGLSEGLAKIEAYVGDNTSPLYFMVSVTSGLTSYLLGDINSDDNVNYEDALILQQYLAKKNPVVMNFKASDIDSDGETDIFDLIYLKRYLNSGTFPNKRPSETTSVTTTTTTTTTTTITTTTANSQDEERAKIEKVVEIVNEERAKVGLDPVKLNETLTSAAMLRAEEITELFSHTRPNGESWYTVYDEFGINYYTAAENIAAGNSTAEKTMDQWINSEGHYNNIINSGVTEIGVGYVYDPDSPYGYYWVQLFK